MKKLIEVKAKGDKREVAAPKASRTNVFDLVGALQERLGNVKGKKKTRPKRL
jgi:non-homologous end joining protein Ku